MLNLKSITVLMLVSLLTIDVHANVTPSDVYARVKAVEGAMIKKFSANKRQRIDTIKLTEAKPLHVYAIATALNEKIIILNGNQKMAQMLRPIFPNKEIKPVHVFNLILALEHNLSILHPNSNFHIEPVSNKDPKDVLRALVRCNLLIDNLLDKKLSPEYPYQIVQQINQLLSKANAQSKRPLLKLDYPLYANVKPNDVFINAENMFKTLMSSAHLKYQINYPQRPYYSPYDEKDIKPIHVFTVTVMNRILLQDYLRRNRVNVTITFDFKSVEKILPKHVYQQYEKALFLLRVYLSEP